MKSGGGEAGVVGRERALPRVLLVGANGFIGSAIEAALRMQGCEVVGCVRSVRVGSRKAGRPVVVCDMATDVGEAAWLPRLGGIDAVVNAAGILRPRGADTFEAVHVEAPLALFRACSRAGVRRVVQVSALGDPADGEFVASKHRCDAELLRLGLDALVLRPSVVCSPRGSYGGTSLLRALAALPGVLPLPNSGTQRLQPVLLEDLGRVVAAAIVRAEPQSGIMEIGGPQIVTLAEYLRIWRRWLGFPTVPEWWIPAGLIRLGTTVGEHCSRGPLGLTMWRMLERGNVTAPDAWMQVRDRLGVGARALEVALDEVPAQTQDRLAARLYFWLPILRIALASLWIGSGVVGLTSSAADVGVAIGGPASASVMGLARASGVADLLLGALCLTRCQPRWVLGVMLAMLAGYTLAIGIFWPNSWLDPFGSLLKNLPLFAALGLLLATEERR